MQRFDSKSGFYSTHVHLVTEVVVTNLLLMYIRHFSCNYIYYCPRVVIKGQLHITWAKARDCLEYACNRVILFFLNSSSPSMKHLSQQLLQQEHLVPTVLKIKLTSHLSHQRGQKLTKSMTFKAPFKRTGSEFTTCRALQAVNKWAAEYCLYIIWFIHMIRSLTSWLSLTIMFSKTIIYFFNLLMMF